MGAISPASVTCRTMNDHHACRRFVLRLDFLEEKSTSYDVTPRGCGGGVQHTIVGAICNLGKEINPQPQTGAMLTCVKKIARTNDCGLNGALCVGLCVYLGTL